MKKMLFIVLLPLAVLGCADRRSPSDQNRPSDSLPSAPQPGRGEGEFERGSGSMNPGSPGSTLPGNKPPSSGSMDSPSPGSGSMDSPSPGSGSMDSPSPGSGSNDSGSGSDSYPGESGSGSRPR